jgi:UDP-glucose 4-epimerase
MIGRACVTGGAGFVGSHMVRTLLEAGIKVRVVDNFRTGRYDFLPTEIKKDFNHIVRDVEVIRGDILDHELMLRAIDGCDWVVHLAANPDARGERRGVQFNIDQNILGTANVLDAMNHVGTTRILYASSASIYGNTRETPTPEDFRMTSQASFYGASKLAGEGLIGAYCEMYGFTGILGRWVHILGQRYLHGHIIDFIRKLRRDPKTLHILGDGSQAKSGLHARNLTDGLLLAMQAHDPDEGVCEPYNFGGDTLLPVAESAKLICERLAATGWLDNPQVKFTFSGRRDGGWVGDNPSLVLDSTKARTNLGWAPTMSVPDGIRATVDWLTSARCRYL